MAETLSDYQKDILVRTVLGEARGEGLDGMEAVAQVIRNRSASGQFPADPAAVALQPSQFSVWNTGEGGGRTNFSKGSDLYKRAEQAVERVFSGQVPDRTNGALYYHTPAVSPYWADEANQYGTTRLGNHIFYNGRPTPPGEIPNQVASLTDTVGPRVAPNPATISPDLALMRNPQMSSSARMAQVTPPLPQPRPNRMDIHPFDPAVNTPRPNADGSISTEVTRTVQLPDGSWANVPSLWWGSGSTVRDFGQMSDDQLAGLASRYEQLNGKPFPRYSDLSTAEAAAISRSNAGGGSAAPITGAPAPLPRPRPASPMDIARAPGTTVATVPTSMRPGQSQIERITPMPSAREIAMAPGQTIATIPTTPRALPALPRTIPGQSQIERTMPSAREIASAPGTTIATIPTSGIGQPPATRTVPSVPYTLQPTAREIAQAPGTTIATIPTTTRPNAAQINDAARRASLTATQGYVDRALPSVPTAVQATARTAPIGSSAQNIAAQRAEQLSQRPTGPYRLAPGPIGLTPNTNGVRLNQPPIQVVPSPFATPRSIAPVPMAAGMRPLSPARINPQPMPQMAYSPSPLKITVNGANSYSAPRSPPMTAVQALQAQGMSASQAYDAANAAARGAPSLEDRVRGGTSGSGDSGYRIAMELPPSLLAQLNGGFIART